MYGKKMMASVIALAMAFGSVSLTAFAEDAENVGSYAEFAAILDDLNANGGEKTIKLTGDFSLESTTLSDGTLTILGEGYTLSTKPSYSVNVSGNAVLNLGAADYDGGLELFSTSSGALIFTRGNGTLNIYDGTGIKNPNATGQAGGICAMQNSTVNMYGGKIYDSRTYSTGSAMHMMDSAKFNMYDGTIDNCKGYGLAAILMANDGTPTDAVFHMYGGTIKNSGAQVAGAVAVTQNAEFIMDGGTIENCNADMAGGAVFVQDNGNVELNGGTIYNNHAGQVGGAVYVAEGGTVTVSSNVAISNNTADIEGSDIYNDEDGTVIISAVPSGMTLDDCGHDIDGWYADDSTYGLWTEDSVTKTRIDPQTITEIIGLKAAHGSSYTVTYKDGVGGTLFVDQVYEDIAAGSTVPDFVGTLEREGYTFLGWYTDDDNLFDLTSTISADTVLTAKWTLKIAGDIIVDIEPSITTYAVTPEIKSDFDIYLKASDDSVINEWLSADITFKLIPDADTNQNSSLHFDVTSSDDIIVTDLGNGRYELHMRRNDEDPSVLADGVTAPSGNKIKIGVLSVYGYGKGQILVDNAASETNAVHTTKTVNNIVDSYYMDGSTNYSANTGKLTIDETLVDGKYVGDSVKDFNIMPPAKNLKINIEYPNNIKDNAASYQDMTVKVSGSDLKDPIIIKLGEAGVVTFTDAYADSEVEISAVKDSDGNVEKYVIDINGRLVQYMTYNVEVSGAGYRTARYTVRMEDDKSLTFWNNVMDNNTYIEEGVGTASKTTFLAGDIVKDGEINIYDLSAVVSYFGMGELVLSHPEYAKYDLNRDGKIDSKDVAYVLVSWGN